MHAWLTVYDLLVCCRFEASKRTWLCTISTWRGALLCTPVGHDPHEGRKDAGMQMVGRQLVNVRSCALHTGSCSPCIASLRLAGTRLSPAAPPPAVTLNDARPTTDCAYAPQRQPCDCCRAADRGAANTGTAAATVRHGRRRRRRRRHGAQPRAHGLARGGGPGVGAAPKQHRGSRGNCRARTGYGVRYVCISVGHIFRQRCVGKRCPWNKDSVAVLQESCCDLLPGRSH